MNATQFEVLLYQLRACSEAIKWAQGKDPQTFWDTCPRADWLLWLVGRMVDKEGWPTRKEVVLVACDCAEEALSAIPAGENRPKDAIETARRCARGEATIDEVRSAAAYAEDYAAEASDAAAAAYADDYAADAAADASAYASAAVYHAAYAACSAADYSAAVCAAFSASAGVPQNRLLEIVRKRIPIPFKEESK